MEGQAIDLLERQMERLDDYPEVRAKLQEHLNETRGQQAALEQAFNLLDSDPSPEPVPPRPRCPATTNPHGSSPAMAEDPRHAGPTPLQPEQQQEPPGYTTEMRPTPDHGEESYEGCDKLEGRAAIITGADSGIGRAVAIAFAREGADLLISYLPEEEDDARETARWVEQAGRRVVLVPGDISDQRHCKPSKNGCLLRVPGES
jgi:hypothetical protein